MANDVGFEHRDYKADGDRAEQEFVNAKLLEKPHTVVKKSSEENDMFKHWDYSFDGITYDIKASRTVGSLNAKGDYYTYLELVNRLGEAGSLYGEAMMFAFELVRPPYLNHFLEVPRQALVKYIEDNLIDEYVDANESVNKKYKAFNQQSVLTAVSLEKICVLPNTKLIPKQ